jgi:hypothetical protein
MPSKVAKAILSQSAVALGIAVDKVRLLHGQGLEPDPATELCKLLGINRSQLPDVSNSALGKNSLQAFHLAVPLLTSKQNLKSCFLDGISRLMGTWSGKSYEAVEPPGGYGYFERLAVGPDSFYTVN